MIINSLKNIKKICMFSVLLKYFYLVNKKQAYLRFARKSA